MSECRFTACGLARMVEFGCSYPESLCVPSSDQQRRLPFSKIDRAVIWFQTEAASDCGGLSTKIDGFGGVGESTVVFLKYFSDSSATFQLAGGPAS
jgi:hypothetical protein